MLNADGSCPPPQVTPGTIASARMVNNGRCVTYNIIPRFNEALKERPVPGSMTLTAEPGSPLLKQIDDWAKFGAPLTDVPAKEVRWDLPGGFGDSWEDARVTVLASKPAPGSPNEVITLRALETNGAVAAALDFTTEEASSGSGGKGVRNAGHDRDAGLVRYELRLNRDDSSGRTAANLNVSVENPVGRSPKDMIPGFQFVLSLRPPRQIQVFSRNGPALAPPLEIPQEVVSEERGKLWLLMCESLATIQEHVLERISFPDISKYHKENYWGDVEEWFQAARLLRGEVFSGTWSDAGMCLIPGMEPPAEVHRAILSRDYDIRIGPKTYHLGIVSMEAASARVNPAKAPVAHDDHLDIQLVPGDDDKMTLRLVSGASAVGSPAPLPSSS